MYLRILIALLLPFFAYLYTAPLEATNTFQAPEYTQFSEYAAKARVVSIIEEQRQSANPYQVVQIELISGPESGRRVIIPHGETYSIQINEFVEEGEFIVVQITKQGEQENFWIVDRYRLPALRWILTGFVTIVILVSGKRGVGSLIGMGISLLIITFYIVPNILNGQNPLFISLTGSLAILITTLYLAHGFKASTTIALISTLISLLVTGIFSYLAVNYSQLTGVGSEEAYSLQIGPTQIINLKGLLLGGIILGTVGVLDDITTSQSAAIIEIKRANDKLKLGDLFKRGHRIGTEHIASLVNTLIMAYAGASLPLFIYFVLNPNDQPLWLLLNSELIAEEIIRTLSGSLGLILAVPITTYLTSWYLTQKKFPAKLSSIKAHTHAH